LTIERAKPRAGGWSTLTGAAPFSSSVEAGQNTLPGPEGDAIHVCGIARQSVSS
jgi:hypothetical protein